jgi:Flp pilus assembly protein TadB
MDITLFVNLLQAVALGVIFTLVLVSACSTIRYYIDSSYRRRQDDKDNDNNG